MKRVVGIVLAACIGFAAFGFILPGCSNAKVVPVTADEVILSKLTPEEVRGIYCLQNYLQAPDGLIFYLADPKAPASYSVLESMGQAMEYAALIGDNKLFAYYAKVTQKYFKAPAGFYYWKIDIKTKHGEPVSALVDDLRLARAYFMANEKFYNIYNRELNDLADLILKTDIDKNGNPCDFYDGDEKTQANNVSLFYLDIETMGKLADLDSKWRQPYQRARDILLSMPENDYGFYPQSYQIDSQAYR